jgi:hypothetical protein
LGILGGIVGALFVYVGAKFMLPTLITGTSQGEQVALNVVPIVLAVIAAGIVVSIFKI